MALVVNGWGQVGHSARRVWTRLALGGWGRAYFAFEDCLREELLLAV